jgi:hypothetical protein
MKKNLLLVFFFLGCFGIYKSAFGQKCQIELQEPSQKLILKNRVNELTVKSNSGNLITRYSIYANGCIKRKLVEDNSGDPQSRFEYFTNTKSTELNWVYSNKNEAGQYQVSEKGLKIFTPSAKLLKSVFEYPDYSSKHTRIETNLYDTINPTKLNWKSEKINFSSKDTFEIITKTNDLRTEIYTIKRKKNGAWQETTKRITTYKNGSFDTFVEFENGKIIKQYDQEDLNKKFENLILPIADEVVMPDEPVVIEEALLTDTVYTNDLTSFSPILKAKSQYMVLKIYTTLEKKELSYTKVYYRKSGLIYKIISPDIESVMNEEYSYIFKSK